MTEHAAPLRYRADIDGMRAIAVAAVVLFHAGVPGMTGGFVGVDVFFVISGYLITSILLKDGSWLRFYQRRARRILPALFVVMAGVLLAGLALMLPGDYRKVATSAAATVGFMSNFYFWRQAGYFQIAGELVPLLHTWSLGVEEQFYIVFPWVLIAGGRLSRPKFVVMLAILAVLSLVLAVVAIHLRQATAAFYLLPTRAWELLVGSLLAAGLVPAIRSAGLRTLVATCGVAALIVPVFLYGNRTPFPGLAALPPVLGAAAIIAAGQGGRHALSPLLEWRPMVGLGLISYSLYLWHWPVLALWHYHVVRDLTAAEATTAVALAVGLTILSWRFVERPFRRGFSDQVIWIASAAGIAVVLAAAGLIHLGRGLPQRFPAAIVSLNEDTDASWRCPLSRMGPFGTTLACRLSRPDAQGPLRTILWGDSHAQMYAPAMLDGNDSAALVNAYGCAPVLRQDHCFGKQGENFRAVIASPAGTIVMALNWYQYRLEWMRSHRGPMPPDQAFEPLLTLLDETVEELLAAGKRVAIVGPVPRPNFPVPSMLSREAISGRAIHPWNQPEATFRAEFARAFAALDALARKPGVTVIQPSAVICHASRCDFAVPGHAVFADHGHVASRFAASLRPMFAAALARSAADPRIARR